MVATIYILCRHTVTTMKPFSVTIEAYDMIDKEVGPGGNSGRVFVPKAWVGKKVKILLVEDLDNEKE